LAGGVEAAIRIGHFHRTRELTLGELGDAGGHTKAVERGLGGCEAEFGVGGDEDEGRLFGGVTQCIVLAGGEEPGGRSRDDEDGEQGGVWRGEAHDLVRFKVIPSASDSSSKSPIYCPKPAYK